MQKFRKYNLTNINTLQSALSQEADQASPAANVAAWLAGRMWGQQAARGRTWWLRIHTCAVFVVLVGWLCCVVLGCFCILACGVHVLSWASAWWCKKCFQLPKCCGQLQSMQRRCMIWNVWHSDIFRHSKPFLCSPRLARYFLALLFKCGLEDSGGVDPPIRSICAEPVWAATSGEKKGYGCFGYHGCK